MMIHEFLATNRAHIIARARAKGASRLDARPADETLRDDLPLFLDRLVGALEAPETRPAGQVIGRGLTVSQVVRDYGDLYQAVLELAAESHAPITASELRSVNLFVDGAIAEAVAEHCSLQDRRRTDAETERLGVLAHELRNRLSAAMLAFSSIKTGRAPFGGSTGQMLWRNLRGLSELVDQSLSQVRLESGAASAAERFTVARLLDDVAVEASLEAEHRQMSFTVSPVAPDLSLLGDPATLNAAVINLLQNAFKFSAPSGRVSLTTSATPDRVLLEVEDECGGLPGGATELLFQPYVQMGPNRRGLGLGLAISRRAVEAFGGELRVRDLPGHGCIFTIDLPRCL